MSKEREEFFYHAGHCGISMGDARQIMRASVSLSSLAVAQCNREWTDRDERRVESLREKIIGICRRHGITAGFSDDPRGYVVTLHIHHEGLAKCLGVA